MSPTDRAAPAYLLAALATLPLVPASSRPAPRPEPHHADA